MVAQNLQALWRHFATAHQRHQFHIRFGIDCSEKLVEFALSMQYYFHLVQQQFL